MQSPRRVLAGCGTASHQPCLLLLILQEILADLVKGPNKLTAGASSIANYTRHAPNWTDCSEGGSPREAHLALHSLHGLTMCLRARGCTMRICRVYACALLVHLLAALLNLIMRIPFNAWVASMKAS